MKTAQPLEPRSCERVESYIEGFTQVEDVNRVRKAYHDQGVDAAMRVAISIKYHHMQQKEAA